MYLDPHRQCVGYAVFRCSVLENGPSPRHTFSAVTKRRVYGECVYCVYNIM